MFRKNSIEITTKASEINAFSSKIDELKNNEYTNFFKQGIFYLNRFLSSDNNDSYDLLNLSAKHFTKAIESKKSKPEPYFYISCIFYLIEEFDISLKYLRKARELNPNLGGIKDLKNRILELKAN